MRRALRLAVRARHASPNPSVGCVLVGSDGVTVGEGWTQPVGQAHAEVMALRMAGDTARGATAYVTLEPCSHHGRTPPCANALLEAGVSRVVAAMTDPDVRVSGRGLHRLREGGVRVEVGLCESEARALNAAFIKHRVTGLPWVVLKTAMSLDGKIATRTGHSRWITSPVARRAVHRQLRDRCDAILTGVGTVLADDPSLTTRLGNRIGRNSLRIVVDSHCRTPLDSQVVRLAAEDGKTLIAVTPDAEDRKQEQLREYGCQVLVCAPDSEGRVSLPDLLARLGTRGDIIGVLTESGGQLAASLLGADLVDRWLAYLAPKVIGGSEAPGPIGGIGIASMDEASLVRSWRLRRCGPDLVIDARFG
jgi:diaminohydroxyphosphoribosylaminopyrimidine deaminase/5-amino-6-(5-phosphoribosylamino)uracil reductase